jgi:hypothetical protein
MIKIDTTEDWPSSQKVADGREAVNVLGSQEY